MREVENPLCELGPWSEWSGCSVTCGKGVQTRDRKYKSRFAAKTCVAGKMNTPIMQQNIECWASEKCEDSEEEVIYLSRYIKALKNIGITIFIPAGHSLPSKAVERLVSLFSILR